MRPYAFSYSDERAISGLKANLPFVPIALSYREQLVQVPALIDSGSAVNVLPYDIGQELGLVWEAQVHFFQEFRVSFDGKAQTFELTLNR